MLDVTDSTFPFSRPTIEVRSFRAVKATSHQNLFLKSISNLTPDGLHQLIFTSNQTTATWTMKVVLPKISLTGLLSLTKAQFHSHYHPSLRYHNIAVGAIIFKRSTANPHKILLLRRAAHDSAFPNMFAIPGGHVEDVELNILHALKREVREETTMLVERVVVQIDPLSWVTEGPGRAEANGSITRFKNLQLSFVCDVKDDAFQIDPEEHSEGMWASKEETKKSIMSTGMRRVVENAFMWKQAHVGV